MDFSNVQINETCATTMHKMRFENDRKKNKAKRNSRGKGYSD